MHLGSPGRISLWEMTGIFLTEFKTVTKIYIDMNKSAAYTPVQPHQLNKQTRTYDRLRQGRRNLVIAANCVLYSDKSETTNIHNDPGSFWFSYTDYYPLDDNII